ncbi:unnamed protein product [Nezara viridula]|uniref:Uncharacterized protein n=1 Tax=Nezara viridula TaxID=85310 RepID=A0A9P0MPA5_NEZVI|nr:unnamed protein product [Nezara viridula]
MVPLLFIFLLFGDSSARMNDFDPLVDRVVGHIDNTVHFFGYDHFDIPPINKTFYKKLGFTDVKAGLVCDRGSVDIALMKRWGPAKADVFDGYFTYSMSLDVPDMKAEVGPCTFTMAGGFAVSGHYKARVNTTVVGVGLKVIQEKKNCRVQLTDLTVDIGGVDIYSGASFIRALQDWTFDAVAYMVRGSVVEKANETIEKFVKQKPQDLVQFPCFKPIKAET